MEPYDFIQASRLINPVADGLSWHLINFMKEFKTPREFRNHAVPLIASSFILDHFPPGMHLFDPRQVFRVLYKDSCHKAIEGLETSPIGSVELAKAVSWMGCSFSSQFVEIQAAGSSRDWHEQQLAKRKDILSQFKSEDTCFSCIRRRPQYTLPCGHMICQVCVRIFSSTSITDPWLVEVKACPVCTAPTHDLTIRLVPDTSRLRVLSIDGGGIRGAAPLGFLKALEDEVGIPNFAIQRHFDVKFGTSSGGLIVMSLDILGWTVDECLDYLKMFANKAFPPRSCILRFMSKVPLLSTFTRLTLFFFTLLTDSKYSANGLESLLMDTYGLHRGITDCSFASHIGSHVGVTLTRARDDYSHLPSGCGQQAVKWWEVYFDGKRVSGHGIYQDGGLAFNNPASIALREAVALTPDGAEPSILLSLGTGSSAPLRKYLSIVYETFPFRVGRALWHRVSSRTSWDTLVGHRRSDSKCNLYRLDDDSEQENPLLDDVTQIDPVHQKAKEIAKGSPILPSLACSFRSALFYFQLDESHPPFFRNGRYECVGQILCRLRSPSVEYCSFMNRLWTNKATFHLEGQSVGVVEEDVYRNFQAVIHFSTMSLEKPLPVRLIEGDTCHDISGSPFSIQWLVRRQKLDATFGTPEHKKRNNRETLESPSSKRLRVRY
ncbi:hypothetical protein FOXG_14055 [Fusarium oxysporum f. sp. lycopersici 4287]|uniref:PNPLA domain-containing protein n=1 Tax=Fusarium oxysporum f. sp. lycopersici (strain 4287 / CBS 123668 / FGSC 9935 / NRRL 34936) TaxID=426428 RepID=A0A0J9VXQ7_FUSO4|nr:hypothetical protein FOXG_14055 [Fusarium oxysporum f. sp. lycopersici 4287]KAJ9413038.1 acyl transferase/acyl hydrolase/lysophospholipase [Fusarium oxysporum]KNB15551.1 hypothetical protein FOXG_14055 [Fusarium oxysporum f. sp. lycopersici 4287]